MIFVKAVLSQQYLPQTLSAAVRTAIGKPLRRAAALTQIGLVGALACIPENRRHLPTALFWQSTSGPRQETLTLLDEVCDGECEPLPYDFLATQPAIAAARIQPFLPGLQSAAYFPLDTEGEAHWSLLIALASNCLDEGRHAQVLCAHLDSWSESAAGHWLALAGASPDSALASLRIRPMNLPDALPDTPGFPLHLASWLTQAPTTTLVLQSPLAPMLAVEIARI